ncbi:hypothetical protein AABB24_024218 [Solanum stoloniferum]|uniref:Uncharacterized protein n=1 Tax=Solanum stoloniferum TaxID=62892 RepID=A0ABD2SMV1_9SOLN
MHTACFSTFRDLFQLIEDLYSASALHFYVFDLYIDVYRCIQPIFRLSGNCNFSFQPLFAAFNLSSDFSMNELTKDENWVLNQLEMQGKEIGVYVELRANFTCNKRSEEMHINI